MGRRRAHKRAQRRRRLAAALLANGRSYGYPLSQQARVRSGAMYPLLDEFMAAGWLADGWAPPEPPLQDPRRFYEVTATGAVALVDVAHPDVLREL